MTTQTKAHAPSPLDLMLGEDAASRFFTDVYEKKPLIVRHDDPDRFKSLLSIAAVDRIVAEHDLREGMLVLANAARDVASEEYVGAGGAIDRAVVAQRYSRGATIILNQLHQADRTLAAFCRSIEQVFTCHVQTNVYLTPPDSQGFHTHYDNHDVFILQVEGEKSWRLFNQVDSPYRGEGFTRGQLSEAPASETFVLKAGDCAYVPRGLTHDAVASGAEPSLHITCGLIVRTWAELMLEAVSEVCVEEPQFRLALPPGYAAPGFDRSEVEATFNCLLDVVAQKARPGNAYDLVADAFIRSREPDLSGAILRGAQPIAGRYRATSTTWRLEADEEGGKLHLIAPYGDTSFPLTARGSVETMLSGAPFDADSLDETGRDVLAKLMARGMVVPNGDGRPS